MDRGRPAATEVRAAAAAARLAKVVVGRWLEDGKVGVGGERRTMVIAAAAKGREGWRAGRW